MKMSKANLRIKEITNILQSLASGDDSDDELEDKDGLEAELSALTKANKARQDKLDDYEKNIKEWEQAGGIGVIYTNAPNTIRELKKLGFK